MNLFFLSWNYIKSKPLNTLLNTLLMALGIAIILVLILLSTQLDENLRKNQKGIDLVVGAKGSPLQLILANVYHIDFPTGNIKLEEAKNFSRNRLIAQAIPLALGDNYKGFRIVGTNHDFTNLYEASVAKGELWKNNLDVVIGSRVAEDLGLEVDDSFFGAHGLSVADMAHEEMSYHVVGILADNNSVIDNLILTNIESVWAVHEHDEGEHDHEEVEVGSAYETGFPEGDEDAEITSMLLKFRSPMGAVTLPRTINANTNMQAASPAFETQRLFSLLGIGVDLLKAFAAIIIIIAGLSIFISLYNALKDRKYDLAIMRSLGASRSKLFFHVILEGVIITILGGGLGFILGHGLTEFLAGLYEKSDDIGLTGMVFVNQEWIVVFISLGIGVFASLIPAVNAYKTDISEVLAKE